jgi:hypothetical protein
MNQLNPVLIQKITKDIQNLKLKSYVLKGLLNENRLFADRDADNINSLFRWNGQQEKHDFWLIIDYLTNKMKREGKMSSEYYMTTYNDDIRKNPEQLALSILKERNLIKNNYYLK